MVEKASEGMGCQPGPRTPAKQRLTQEPNAGVVAPAAVWHATQGHPLKAAGALRPAQKLPPSLPQFLATPASSELCPVHLPQPHLPCSHPLTLLPTPP